MFTHIYTYKYVMHVFEHFLFLVMMMLRKKFQIFICFFVGFCYSCSYTAYTNNRYTYVYSYVHICTYIYIYVGNISRTNYMVAHHPSRVWSATICLHDHSVRRHYRLLIRHVVHNQQSARNAYFRQK